MSVAIGHGSVRVGGASNLWTTSLHAPFLTSLGFMWRRSSAVPSSLIASRKLIGAFELFDKCAEGIECHRDASVTDWLGVANQRVVATENAANEWSTGLQFGERTPLRHAFLPVLCFRRD